MYFFLREGVKATGTVTIVEAANGVTPAIQGLNICSGVISPRILGRGIYPQDSRGVFTPRIRGHLPPGF